MTKKYVLKKIHKKNSIFMVKNMRFFVYTIKKYVAKLTIFRKVC